LPLAFTGDRMSNKKDHEEYSQKEATARFEAALKSALNTPHMPLKEKPRATRKKRLRKRAAKS
jgi:hypothetical protein